MAEEKRKRGRPKGDMDSAVTTNIKITKQTHARLATYAAMNGMNMSDTIDMLILEKAPKIEDEIERRDRLKQELAEKKKAINPTDD